MGNIAAGPLVAGGGQQSPRLFIKRDESFGSKSPRRSARHAVVLNRSGPEEWAQETAMAIRTGRGSGSAASEGRNGAGSAAALGLRFVNRQNRSQSLEQSGTHSPSSSRSNSSSNSYMNTVLQHNPMANGTSMDRSCLRQSTEPMFNISGDLNPHQIGLVKRAWKLTLKEANGDETEIAMRILLRIFQLDLRTMALFSLKDVPMDELRDHPVFVGHVKTFEPTLVHVMNHLTNATMLSKHLQQLGGRHVNYTGVTYKCSYWKCFTQALIEVMSEQGTHAELPDALSVLGDFCVEQMRIGYRIEYKLQCEAERLSQAQQRRRRAIDHRQHRHEHGVKNSHRELI